MLTGDTKTNALATGRELGLDADDVIAGVMPDGKARVIEELKRKGAIVAMAGDGINDAPVLATAHVRIAMGTGTDVAIESAGVTLVKGDLRGIVRAVRLGRATLANIRQNLALAFGCNVLAVPVAAGDPVSVVRAAPESDGRRSGDEPQLGVGDHECAPPAARVLTLLPAPTRQWLSSRK
jgi:Cu+-exporting ATPase